MIQGTVTPGALIPGTANQRVAVDVAGVSHFYGSRQALCEVSFSIAAGEIVALLGPNGGGKTTLFRLLSTLIPLAHGSIHILGHDLRRDPGRRGGCRASCSKRPAWIKN